MLTEKHVEVAARMYQARKTAIALLGRERFQAKVEQYRPLLADVMQKKGRTDIEATLDIVRTMQRQGYDGIAQTLALAACVEIMEPYKE